MIEQGDVVQFSGPLLLMISQKHPLLFARLQETGRCHGQVVSVAADHVSIDFGIDNMAPVIVHYDASRPEAVFTIIRKSPPSSPPPLASLPYPSDMPPADVDDDDNDYNNRGPSPGFDTMTPLQYANTAMREGGGCRPKITGIPETVALSQWVMVQFLGFKEQAIIQDLRRTPDHLARYPHPQNEMEAWQKNDQEFRAVQADLAPEEEQLYATALRRLKNWIEPPVVTHPENTPSSDG